MAPVLLHRLLFVLYLLLRVRKSKELVFFPHEPPPCLLPSATRKGEWIKSWKKRKSDEEDADGENAKKRKKTREKKKPPTRTLKRNLLVLKKRARLVVVSPIYKIFFSFPSHFHLAREKRWKCRKKNYNLAERHWRGARMWFYGTVREWRRGWNKNRE